MNWYECVCTLSIRGERKKVKIHRTMAALSPPMHDEPLQRVYIVRPGRGGCVRTKNSLSFGSFRVE